MKIMSNQTQSKLNKGISTPVGIIIIVLVALLAGGILAWHYFGAPKEEVKAPEEIEEPYIKVISPNGGEKWVIGEKNLIKLSDRPVKCVEGENDCEVYNIELINKKGGYDYVRIIRCGHFIPTTAISTIKSEIEWNTLTVLDCCGAGCQSQEIQPGEYKVRIASRYYPLEIIDQSTNYFIISQ
ncbi:MAG: hypothetical protein COZ30_01875 [Candidatus Nealsonbacteria bacterium CG_4_10_14_3_um_filter_36_16]|uniref:Uncharacterized protein n=1 Tax=Candidatus Nealsonbacteria bacterium CG_4_10_14_3_um_filter_36_16 TaxID=1974685 RepID=A0A2M7MF19_9BACT|nr:MAG: hypothetical protein COZ30_01875 [Candidatus Nealsonbacteria bacterium CG_4_10_14_3_um_filter_36_16]